MKANAVKANAIPPQPDETFFPSARTKSVLSAVLSNDQTKKHAIVSAVATARAEIAPTSAHALDVESLKVTGANGHGEYAARCPVSGEISGHRD